VVREAYEKAIQLDNSLIELLRELVVWKPSWRMVPGATVRSIDGKNYYSAIDVIKGDMPIRFLLIPKGEYNETFYIMENKVSVDQFEKFAILNKQFVKFDDWKRGAAAGNQDLNNTDKQHPVMRVHVEDAQNFAHWLGGDLPMPSEWDKAAGRYESNRAEGPFQGTWDPNHKTAIAVGRDREGPMEVGKATKDISIFGCRDMAGNGREWTRKLFADPNERTVPIEKPKVSNQVILRGVFLASTFQLSQLFLQVSLHAALGDKDRRHFHSEQPSRLDTGASFEGHQFERSPGARDHARLDPGHGFFQ
jgi:hypothetical protein